MEPVASLYAQESAYSHGVPVPSTFISPNVSTTAPFLNNSIASLPFWDTAAAPVVRTGIIISKELKQLPKYKWIAFVSLASNIYHHQH